MRKPWPSRDPAISPKRKWKQNKEEFIRMNAVLIKVEKVILADQFNAVDLCLSSECT